jgi:hypothetical protein
MRLGLQGSRALLIVWAALLGALLFPSAGQATVTIGSSFAASGNSGTGPAVVLSQSALPGRQVSSPVNGTLVRWRFNWSACPSTAGLRVIRPMSAGGFLFAVSASHSFACVSEPFEAPASIPIAIGDRIAIDETLTGVGNAVQESGVSGAETDNWSTSPSDGSTSSPDLAPTTNAELLLNADIEPTSAFAVSSTTLNKKKGTATISLNLPNPGQLAATVTGATIAGSLSRSVTPGPVDLVVKAKGKKKRKLNTTGKVKVAITATFTPTGGTSSAQTLKVKLKKKRS